MKVDSGGREKHALKEMATMISEAKKAHFFPFVVDSHKPGRGQLVGRNHQKNGVRPFRIRHDCFNVQKVSTKAMTWCFLHQSPPTHTTMRLINMIRAPIKTKRGPYSQKAYLRACHRLSFVAFSGRRRPGKNGINCVENVENTIRTCTEIAVPSTRCCSACEGKKPETTWMWSLFTSAVFFPLSYKHFPTSYKLRLGLLDNPLCSLALSLWQPPPLPPKI